MALHAKLTLTTKPVTENNATVGYRFDLHSGCGVHLYDHYAPILADEPACQTEAERADMAGEVVSCPVHRDALTPDCYPGRP